MNKFDNQLKDKLEPRDLDGLKADIKTLATKEELSLHLKASGDRIQSFVN